MRLVYKLFDSCILLWGLTILRKFKLSYVCISYFDWVLLVKETFKIINSKYDRTVYGSLTKAVYYRVFLTKFVFNLLYNINSWIISQKHLLVITIRTLFQSNTVNLLIKFSLLLKVNTFGLLLQNFSNKFNWYMEHSSS